MKFEDAAQQLTPEIYERFKQALELGKWPDGRELTKEQKEICMQAVMLYEARHQMEEKERIGYIDRSRKTTPCGSDKEAKKDGGNDDTDTIRVLH